MIAFSIRQFVLGLVVAAFTLTAAHAAPKKDKPAAAGKVWKEHATGMEFVWVPKGCFQMGSPASEPGRDPDEQQHQACVEGHWLGKYEVTNAQYRQFRRRHNSGQYGGHNLNHNSQPVVDVSWDDAEAFAKWMSDKAGKPFRLPTEVEWEYAARAGTSTSRYFGDDDDQLCRHANISDRSAKALPGFADSYDGCDDGFKVTAPVGSFIPNSLGLHDMIGNAWEWTSSLFGSGYISPEKIAEARDTERWRVIKGGAWNLKPLHARAADRYGRAPEFKTIGIGFRLALTHEPDIQAKNNRSRK